MIFVLDTKYITGDCGSSIIDLNRPLPMSNVTTTKQVDTDFNNDDNSGYFFNPRKHNHNATELGDTNTTTNQVHIKDHPSICQQSP